MPCGQQPNTNIMISFFPGHAWKSNVMFWFALRSKTKHKHYDFFFWVARLETANLNISFWCLPCGNDSHVSRQRLFSVTKRAAVVFTLLLVVLCWTLATLATTATLENFTNGWENNTWDPNLPLRKYFWKQCFFRCLRVQTHKHCGFQHCLPPYCGGWAADKSGNILHYISSPLLSTQCAG